MTEPLPLPEAGRKVFTDDPVRISWVVFSFIQAVVAILLLGEVLSEVVGGIVVGVVAAAYAAVSELFVRPETVPREPLAELAAAQKRAPPTPPG